MNLCLHEIMRNDQSKDEFKYKSNSYKKNNRKHLRDEKHKRAEFFSRIQKADYSSFKRDTKITFKTDSSSLTSDENFWIGTRKT